jgi:fluoroquinolone resistance protein
MVGGAKSVLPPSIKFHNTVLDYSGFFGLKLHKWEFVECIAHEVDFTEADLTDAKCMETDFAHSRFLHANLTRADFSQARNYAIDPTSATVKGAIFTLPEAISLLTGLGVVIDDPAF